MGPSLKNGDGLGVGFTRMRRVNREVNEDVEGTLVAAKDEIFLFPEYRRR